MEQPTFFLFADMENKEYSNVWTDQNAKAVTTKRQKGYDGTQERQYGTPALSIPWSVASIAESLTIAAKQTSLESHKNLTMFSSQPNGASERWMAPDRIEVRFADGLPWAC